MSDFIKIKNFCVSKNIIKRVKRQSTEKKKIFANHILSKSLTYRTPITQQQQKVQTIQSKNRQRI